VFSFQNLRTPTIHGCHASIDVRVNGYNMLWVQLQAEGRMQSNTDRSCLLISFTSAPNTWKNCNHAGHADPLAIGAKKSVHFQLYFSTRPLLGHSISSKCSHYHHHASIEEAWNLSLDNDNDMSRNDSSYNSRISFRLPTHKYWLIPIQQDPTPNPWLCPPTTSKKFVIVDSTGWEIKPAPWSNWISRNVLECFYISL